MKISWRGKVWVSVCVSACVLLHLSASPPIFPLPQSNIRVLDQSACLAFPPCRTDIQRCRAERDKQTLTREKSHPLGHFHEFLNLWSVSSTPLRAKGQSNQTLPCNNLHPTTFLLCCFCTQFGAGVTNKCRTLTTWVAAQWSGVSDLRLGGCGFQSSAGSDQRLSAWNLVFKVRIWGLDYPMRRHRWHPLSLTRWWVKCRGQILLP